MAKTVLITGTSSGIGRAAGLLFQAKGWNVAATMRDPSKAEEWTRHPSTLAVRLDVTDLDSVRAAVRETVDRFGTIDVVANNAGYSAVGPFEASTPEQVDRQIATNVTGLLNVTRELIPIFRARREGIIINVASIAGHMTFPLYSLYHTTKWAVEGFSESIAFELEPFGIRVKIIEPGPIKTDFYERSMDTMTRPGLHAYDDYVARVMPVMQRAGASAPGPEIVAETIYRAATDGSKKLRYPVNTRGILTLRRLLPTGMFLNLIKGMVSQKPAPG